MAIPGHGPQQSFMDIEGVSSHPVLCLGVDHTESLPEGLGTSNQNLHLAGQGSWLKEGHYRLVENAAIRRCRCQRRAVAKPGVSDPITCDVQRVCPSPAQRGQVGRRLVPIHLPRCVRFFGGATPARRRTGRGSGQLRRASIHAPNHCVRSGIDRKKPDRTGNTR